MWEINFIMVQILQKKINDTQLLNKINSRDKYAFGELYDLFYQDFHRYTSSLYRGYPVESTDIIHDAFMYVWQNRTISFESIQKFKAYIIVSIKNSFNNYINHSKYETRYKDHLLTRSIKYDLLEVEIFSVLDEVSKILPSECAAILKLHLEGWSADEIAAKFGKTRQTIYNKKQEAITILRKKYPNKLLLLNLFVLAKHGVLLV